MNALRRRVDALSAAAPPGGCRDAWHNSEAGKLAVVHEDMETGICAEPPTCPTCNAEPDLVIRVTYERDNWRRLNDAALSRTSIEW